MSEILSEKEISNRRHGAGKPLVLDILKSHETLRARVAELESAIGRKDQAANVMTNLTDKVQDRNEILERERDVANRRADKATALYKDAIQRGDSNYAAFEQVTKIAEGLREHLRKMLDALSVEIAIGIAQRCEVARWLMSANALRSYAHIARDAQASLSGTEAPKP